ncbi:hypothetical protein T01_7641 [Trichinella spiralis]|uniref:Uncharacterized protein n=1 Tax=Trichinella spiralis TaxID=6334 RepID=A0A0V0YSF3_TRISP|nr:hypothetical protein T01_7641 [Trichinella spiralis]
MEMKTDSNLSAHQRTSRFLIFYLNKIYEGKQ